jgi:hypothetical protein
LELEIISTIYSYDSKFTNANLKFAPLEYSQVLAHTEGLVDDKIPLLQLTIDGLSRFTEEQISKNKEIPDWNSDFINEFGIDKVAWDSNKDDVGIYGLLEIITAPATAEGENPEFRLKMRALQIFYATLSSIGQCNSGNTLRVFTNSNEYFKLAQVVAAYNAKLPSELEPYKLTILPYKLYAMENDKPNFEWIMKCVPGVSNIGKRFDYYTQVNYETPLAAYIYERVGSFISESSTTLLNPNKKDFVPLSIMFNIKDMASINLHETLDNLLCGSETMHNYYMRYEKIFSTDLTPYQSRELEGVFSLLFLILYECSILKQRPTYYVGGICYQNQNPQVLNCLILLRNHFLVIKSMFVFHLSKRKLNNLQNKIL